MERKSDRVRRLVAGGEYKEALRIAKGFRMGITEEQHDDMVRGYECMTNPRLYRSLGMDTEEIAQKAVATVIRLYGA
jgi:hypothetical protein